MQRQIIQLQHKDKDGERQVHQCYIEIAKKRVSAKLQQQNWQTLNEEVRAGCMVNHQKRTASIGCSPTETRNWSWKILQMILGDRKLSK